VLGDFLYRLLPRDLQSHAHQFHIDGAAASGAAASHVVDLDFPDDRIFIVSLITIRANGSGGQEVTDLQLSLCDLNAGGGVCRVIYRNQVNEANKNVTLTPAGMILAPPRSLEAFADFSAGVASNSLDLIVIGYLLPRANFVP